MRKLISLLTIAMTSSCSIATTSCSVNNQNTKLEKAKLNLTEAELESKLNSSSNIYDQIRLIIASKANQKITADDIKNDSDIVINAYEGTEKLDDDGKATKLNEKVDIALQVSSYDSYFYGLSEVLDVKDFETDISNLDFSQIIAKGNTYSDTYDALRTIIANAASLKASDIQSGIEKDNVLISMYVNDNWVSENDNKLTSGDNVTIKYEVINSLHYKLTNGWIKKNISIPKATLNTNNIDITKIVYGTEYSDALNIIRSQIANIASISSDDISNGVEKDNVLISMYANDNWVASSDTKINYGDKIYFKIAITKNSKHFTATNGFFETKSIDIAKKDLSTFTLKGENITIGSTYENAYSEMRNQIAALGNIDPSVITSGSEKNNVLISMYVNDNWVASSDIKINYGDKIYFKYMITSASKFYVAKDWTTSNVINEDKQDISSTVNITTDDITVNKTTYSDVINMTKDQLAKSVNLSSSDLNDNDITITLNVNNQAVKDDSTTFKQGDSIIIDYVASDKSRYFKAINKAYQVGKIAQIDLNSYKLDTTNVIKDATYNQVYNDIENQLASKASVDVNVIKDEESKGNINFYVYYIDASGTKTKAENANTALPFGKGGQIELSYEINASSTMFKAQDEIGTTIDMPEANKNITIGDIEKGDTYQSVYDKVLPQLVTDKVTIDNVKSEIANGNLKVQILSDGNVVSDLSKTIHSGEGITAQYEVLNNSIYFAKTGGFISSNKITVDKASVDVNLGEMVDVNKTYKDLYSEIYSAIAKQANISVDDVKSYGVKVLMIADVEFNIAEDDTDKLNSLPGTLEIKITITNSNVFNNYNDDENFIIK